MLEKLTEILAAYFKIGGDCYTYYLERDKAAFEIGAMTTDDFREFGESDVEEIAAHLIAKGVTLLRPIPLTERVPTLADTDPDHHKVMVYSIPHKAWQVEHISIVDVHPEWYSHWMPMPKVPRKDGA